MALDELPEFNRQVLEVMRQPLEEGRVTIARAAASLTYLARCIFVGYEPESVRSLPPVTLACWRGKTSVSAGSGSTEKNAGAL